MIRTSRSRRNFFENIKHYIDLKLEYLKLDFSEKLSILISNLVLLVFMSILVAAIFILVLILINILLTQWIGIAWLATLIEIGIVALVMFLVWCFREKLIVNPVSNSILKTLYSDDENEKE